MLITKIEPYQITLELTSDDCIALASACHVYGARLDSPEDEDKATAARSISGFFSTAFMASQFFVHLSEAEQVKVATIINEAQLEPARMLT